jgi:diacylglycerol O-acyltransferase / wax synthase
MTQRLTPLDATFLYAEHPTATMHVGGVLTFAAPPGGRFDVAAFIAEVGRRLALAPRLRQTVRTVPGRLGAPVWADDDRFDLAFHVRHLALPSPGTDDLLRELVGTLMDAPLDRSRPLWELCVVEGLADGRTALVAKVHHALADGLTCMQLGGILLDTTAEPRLTPTEDWRPAAAPSDLSLAVGAALGALRGTRSVLAAARSLPIPDAATLGRFAGSALEAARRATGPAPVPALRVATAGRRRHGVVRATLADHRTVRRAHGGTVNDIVLAVVAGGLRRWLAGRGDEPAAGACVRAMVPVSARSRDRGAAGNGISAHLVDLPVGLDDPLARLARVRAAMNERKRRGPTGVDALAVVAGVVPAAVHELGARFAGRQAGWLYDVLVSNVPGPPRPLYAGGAELLDLHPVVPLAAGQAVAIGVASYAGALHYGITADGSAVPDVDALAAALEESLAELVVRSPRPAARPVAREADRPGRLPVG